MGLYDSQHTIERIARRWASGSAALALLFVCAPSVASVVVAVSYDVSSEQGGHNFVSFEQVCNTPASVQLASPFPEISATVTNGALRGRLSVAGSGADSKVAHANFGLLAQGTVSFAEGASLEIRDRSSGFRFALRTRGHANMSATTTQQDCPGEQCDRSGAGATFFSFLSSGPEGEHSSVSPEFVRSADTSHIQLSAGETLNEIFTLNMSFAPIITVGYDVKFEGNASPGGAALVDFSNTVEFLSLGVYDGDIDVTRFFNIDFDGMTIAAPTAPIPEPETYAMLLAGLGVLGFAARRRKRNA